MSQFFARLGKFTLWRVFSLLLALVVALFLTVVVANMGGELDRVKRGEIKMAIGQAVFQDPSNKGVDRAVLEEMVSELSALEYARLGLDRPFFPERAARYTWNAFSLQLGRAEQMASDSGGKDVRQILMERLPSTLILFATAELLLFFVSLLYALFLSRRYGSFVDRLSVGLAPSSAAPGWFYGIFLILVFASVLRVLPWGGMVSIPPPQDTGVYLLSLLEHMILPVGAIFIGAIFASVYSWRTFFLIYSSEDYVELARAKGLSGQAVERRYILRPTLPPIITSFLLLLITMWMGQIVLEHVFNWPGIGQIFYRATQVSDTPVIVGVIVIYGYMLAATVFLLDFIYAILDPRVRVGVGGAGR